MKKSVLDVLKKICCTVAVLVFAVIFTGIVAEAFEVRNYSGMGIMEDYEQLTEDSSSSEGDFSSEDDSSSENTSSENTSSGNDSSSENTSSENTSSGNDSSSENTSSENTSSGNDSSSENTSSENTSSGNVSSSENTSSENSSSLPSGRPSSGNRPGSGSTSTSGNASDLSSEASSVTTSSKKPSSSKSSSASQSGEPSESETSGESEDSSLITSFSQSESVPGTTSSAESSSEGSEETKEPEKTDENENEKQKGAFMLFVSAHKVLTIAAVTVIVLLIAAGAVIAVVKIKKNNVQPVGVVHGEKDDDMIYDIIPIGFTGIPNGSVWAAKASIQGTRDYQQDYVLIPAMKNITEDVIEKQGCFCVLCDGMGGLSDGGRASMICAETMMNTVYEGANRDIGELMREAVEYADEEIYNLRGRDGKPTRSGTTMISVHIKNGKLNYSSVGDSRIYVYRKGQIKQITRDHNYFEDLIKGCPEGSPEWMEAYRHPKKDALTSYVGMGGIKHLDVSQQAIELERNDVIILCSDGLYRTLTESEFCETIGRYIEHIDFLPGVLVASAFDKDKVHQDNTSAIVIKYLG